MKEHLLGEWVKYSDIKSQWIKVNRKALPDIEILCINNREDCLLGYLSYNDDTESYECDSESEVLEDVIYYMLVPPLD